MDEILKTLAEHTGISPDTAKNGLGAVFAFLKAHLPSGLFGQVEQSVPGASHAVDSFEENKATEPGGGLLGAVTGLAGKLLGGGGAGEAAKLISMLGAAGLSLGQIQSFLPKALELLRAHLPADVIAKVEHLLAGALNAGAAEKA